MVNTHVRKFIVCISYFSQGGHKTPGRSNLKEEGLVFARNLKVWSIMVGKALCAPSAGQLVTPTPAVRTLGENNAGAQLPPSSSVWDSSDWMELLTFREGLPISVSSSRTETGLLVHSRACQVSNASHHVILSILFKKKTV